MDTSGARRLSTMIRHAMHTFAAALWLVGLVGVWRHAGPTWQVQTALAAALAAAYVAGLAVQRSRPRLARSRTVGVTWVAVLLVLWAVLVALGTTWTWLCFPLLFLALFIVPRPVSWLVVVVAAGLAALSPLVRGEPLGPGSVIGPVFGAGFAVVIALVFGQLRRDAETQRRLSARVASLAAEQARVHEREALARDLHDTLAQGLNSIVVLSRAGRSQHPEAMGVLDGIEQVARDNLARTRHLVRELAPPERGSLVRELAAVVDEAAAQQRLVGSGLSLEFRADGAPQPLDPAVQRALVMAARTLVANVVQHARATRCVVSLAWLDDQACLDVVDDGVGFDPARTGPDSFGLRAVRSRMREVGGSVEVESAPGEGTSVALVLPIDERDEDG